jgi:hypothetical protein
MRLMWISMVVDRLAHQPVHDATTQRLADVVHPWMILIAATWPSAGRRFPLTAVGTPGQENGRQVAMSLGRFGRHRRRAGSGPGSLTHFNMLMSCWR